MPVLRTPELKKRLATLLLCVSDDKMRPSLGCVFVDNVDPFEDDDIVRTARLVATDGAVLLVQNLTASLEVWAGVGVREEDLVTGALLEPVTPSLFMRSKLPYPLWRQVVPTAYQSLLEDEPHFTLETLAKVYKIQSKIFGTEEVAKSCASPIAWTTPTGMSLWRAGPGYLGVMPARYKHANAQRDPIGHFDVGGLFGVPLSFPSGE